METQALTWKIRHYVVDRKERKRGEGRGGSGREERRGKKMPFDARGTFVSVLSTLVSNIQE